MAIDAKKVAAGRTFLADAFPGLSIEDSEDSIRVAQCYRIYDSRDVRHRIWISREFLDDRYRSGDCRDAKGLGGEEQDRTGRPGQCADYQSRHRNLLGRGAMGAAAGATSDSPGQGTMFGNRLKQDELGSRMGARPQLAPEALPHLTDAVDRFRDVAQQSNLSELGLHIFLLQSAHLLLMVKSDTPPPIQAVSLVNRSSSAAQWMDRPIPFGLVPAEHARWSGPGSSGRGGESI
jgi:hypothetical protein